MANPHRGEVEFEADGKTWTLHYSADALCRLEDHLDKSVIAIMGEMQRFSKKPERIRLGFVRALFWAGLVDGHPRITIKEAGELLVKAGGVLGGMTLIGQAMARTFPQADAKEKTDGKRRPPRRAAAVAPVGTSHLS